MTSANLILNMRPTVSHEERAAIISDFECGRSHILFQMALKTSHWKGFPWVVHGLADTHGQASLEILQQALESTSCHPQISKLKENPLRQELEEFRTNPDVLFNSEDPNFLRCARECMATLRMVSVVERRIEGKHATSKKGISHAPHHSCPYVSLLHRIGEIKCKLDDDPETIVALARHVQKARSSFASVNLLNLDCHPDSQDCKHCRDTGYVKIIYHADTHVKYTMTQPKLSCDKPPSHEQTLAIKDQTLELDLAQKHVRDKFRQGAQRNEFLSFPMSGGAFKALKDLLVPPKDGVLPEIDFSRGGLVVSEGDGGTDFYSSVPLSGVDSGPVPEDFQRLVFWKLQAQGNLAQAHREKVAGEQSLSGCLAVATHPCLRVDRTAEVLTLSLSPMRIANVSCDEVPLVLNSLCLSLEQLREMKVWRSKDHLSFTFAFHYLRQLPPDVHDEVPVLLAKMMNRPCGIHVGKASNLKKKLLSCLLRDGVIVEMDSNECSVKLTDKGVHLVETCVDVTGGLKFLDRPPKEVKPLDMSTYEVVLELQAAGFQQRVVSAKESKRCKKLPFTDGGKKEWLTKEGSLSVSHLYLVALLTASEHGKDVPHFEKELVYKQLLGLSCESQVTQKRAPRKNFSSLVRTSALNCSCLTHH